METHSKFSLVNIWKAIQVSGILFCFICFSFVKYILSVENIVLLQIGI